MKRMRPLLCALVSLVAAGCGGGSSPSAPSRPAPALSPGTGAIAIGQSASSSMVDSSSADLASCLNAPGDPACFSGARLSALTVSAAVTAPGAPTGFSVDASGSYMTMNWTAPSSGDPVTTYVIEAGSSPGASNLANLATGSTATTFSDFFPTRVFIGTSYFRVRAQNAGGLSAPSNEAKVTLDGSACTSAPGAPSGSTGTVSGGTVTLTWTAPIGGCAPTSYILQAGSAAGLSNLASSNTGNTATSYVASGVGAGTYYVRVLAANAYGQSAPSNESILTVGPSACTSAPNAPSGLGASATGSTVTLTWTAPTGGCAPTSYILQAGSAAGLSNLANSTTGNTATSYVASGVGAGTYYVRVLAANAYGSSAASNEVIVTVGVPTPTPGGVGGTWAGLAPDGMITFDPDACGRDVNDLQLVLTQTGSNITGTMTWRIRESFYPPDVGKVFTQSLTGSVNGNAVSFSVAGRLTGSATFTSTRMTGTFTDSANTRGCQAATFAVNR